MQAWFNGREHSLQPIVRPGVTTQFFVSGAGSERDPEERPDVARWYGPDAGVALVSVTAKEMLM